MSEGLRQQQPSVLRGSRRPDRARTSAHPSSRSVEDDDAEYCAVREPGRTRVSADRPGRAEPEGDRDRSRQPRALRLEDDRSRSEGRRSRTSRSIGGRIVAQYLVDVQSRLSLFALDGAPQGDVALPGAGTVGGIGGREDAPEILYSFSSPLTPTTVFAYRSRRRRRATPFEARHAADRRQPVRDQGAVRHVEGRDARAVLPDGAQGPAARRQPSDDAVRLRRVFDQHAADLPARRAGVARARRHLGDRRTCAAAPNTARRGTRPGMLEKKQNVFDDFIAVAEHLIKERYTSPAKLGIMGGSNGGLLVGAVMEQRPGSVRRRAARGRRDGHAALRQVHRRRACGRPSTARRRTRRSSRSSSSTRRCRTSSRARAIRRRSSRRPITTTASCRAIRSSSPRRCRRRRRAPSRC